MQIGVYVWSSVWRWKLLCMYGVLFEDVSWCLCMAFSVGDVIWCVCMAFCVKMQVVVYVWRSVWRCKLVCMYGVLCEDAFWWVCMAFFWRCKLVCIYGVLCRCKLVCMYGVLCGDVSWCVAMAFCLEI